MKPLSLVTGIALTLALVSCSRPHSPVGTNEGTTPGEGPHPIEAGLKGSTVGNGLVAYRNSRLGLNFKYPENWQLKEEPTNVSLSNAGIAAKDAVSRITFSLLTDLEGEHMTSQHSLKDHLESHFPDSTWKQTNLSGRAGFWSEVLSGSRRVADYFLLDENKNVFKIHLEVNAGFQGEETINSIIKSLTIDGEGPVVRSVRFSKAAASSEETIELVIQAEDEISGIDVAPMGVESKGPAYAWDGPRMGYRMDGEGPNYHRNSLANAYTLTRSGFHQTGPTEIRYRFQIPKNAPIGIVQLKYLTVFDRKGNKTEVRCDVTVRLPAEEAGCTAGENKLSQPFFQVEKGKDPTYFEDKRAPQFVEAYFEKSFVSAADKTQKLYLRANDDTAMSGYLDVSTLDEIRGGGANYGTCVDWNQDLKHLRDDLYYIEGKTEGCFDSSGRPSRNLVNLTHLTLFDVVGNSTSCYENSFEGNTCPLKKIRFELVSP